MNAMRQRTDEKPPHVAVPRHAAPAEQGRFGHPPWVRGCCGVVALGWMVFGGEGVRMN